MNRIILIGNGFDLAHGMKTSYKCFLKFLWYEIFSSAIKDDKVFAKRFISYHFERSYDTLEKLKILSEIDGNWDLAGYKSFFNEFFKNDKVDIELTNSLLVHLSEKVHLQDWVDIEREYHLELVRCSNIGNEEERKLQIKNLNNEFECIKVELENYLKTEQDKNRDKNIQGLEKIINEFINFNDFSSDVLDSLFSDFDNNEYLQNLTDAEIKDYKSIPKGDDNSLFNDIRVRDGSNVRLKYKPKDMRIISFNYTNTIERYLSELPIYEQKEKVNYIHGMLKTTENPIIFGYGDEMSDEYYQLEKLNDNDFLENVKSIKYMNTANHNKLVDFITSEPYQIFIFGHSCGISDRTLLNMLFEHKNCISIKPFYHTYQNGNDSYSDIIRNISRNFNNKLSMRTKVVEKRSCTTLPQSNNQI